MERAATVAGLPLDEEARSAIRDWLALLDRWQGRVNLTSIPAADRVERLVAEVLPAVAHLQGPHVLDIGSGNGSPGLVAALARPELRVTLLEPRQKRWAFLREACRVVGRPDIDVRRERHEEYGGRRADTVVVRALRISSAEALPLLTPHGRWVVLGARPAGAGPGFGPPQPIPGGWRLERST